MDAKLLCPTLSVVLVKTIKALCEINIKYDNKLEIFGSLHVRSDGQKVLTCLLDEETVKGQYDAARVAELAARLSMAAATFPFTHLQMSANVNHSQQVAEALFSSIQGDVHILNAAQQQQLPVGMERPVREDNDTVNSAQLSAYHHSSKDNIGQTAVQDGNVTEEMRQTVSALRQQEETRQVAAVLKQHEEVRNRHQQNAEESVQPAHHPNRKQRQSDVAKLLGMTKAATGMATAASYSTGASSTDPGIVSTLYGQQVGQNPIKLPDIQTLAHSLPKYPAVGSKQKTSNSSLQQAILPLVAKSESLPSFSSPGTASDQSAISPNAMPSLDPMMAVALEVQSEIGLDGSTVYRKKFQCMFCGIFLSTKCYLKNHINAMHTRARVYPCELCERYFYSAGALRIHKLRNHWQDSKKHVCTHCGETFLLPIELRKHIVKKHVTTDDQQLLMDSVELKLEDSEMAMPQLQPVDININNRSSLAQTTQTPVCYPIVSDMNHPSTPNSTHTPSSSLEGSGGAITE